MSIVKFNLPATVASSQDLAGLIVEVRAYATWHAHETIKRQAVAGTSPGRPPVSPATEQLVSDWSAKHPLSRQSFDQLIASLEAYVKEAKILTITLAAPPTGAIKTTLVEWCRRHIAADILITFEFNTTLLGGMVVRYGSRVYDWSFRRTILAAAQNFPEVLRRV